MSPKGYFCIRLLVLYQKAMGSEALRWDTTVQNVSQYGDGNERIINCGELDILLTVKGESVSLNCHSKLQKMACHAN